MAHFFFSSCAGQKSSHPWPLSFFQEPNPSLNPVGSTFRISRLHALLQLLTLPPHCPPQCMHHGVSSASLQGLLAGFTWPLPPGCFPYNTMEPPLKMRSLVVSSLCLGCLRIASFIQYKIQNPDLQSPKSASSSHSCSPSSPKPPLPAMYLATLVTLFFLKPTLHLWPYCPPCLEHSSLRYLRGILSYFLLLSDQTSDQRGLPWPFSTKPTPHPCPFLSLLLCFILFLPHCQFLYLPVNLPPRPAAPPQNAPWEQIQSIFPVTTLEPRWGPGTWHVFTELYVSWMMRSKELKEITPWGNLLQGVRGVWPSLHRQLILSRSSDSRVSLKICSVEKHAAFYTRVSRASRQLSMQILT